ncbi:zinc transporter ZntB [Kiloniella majae]|uniref:zinc transporter ZntB n=1 Tax=Kiloniella majae TaxID=1938558 RepID=UPI000A2784E3|nr:zinc transporter ZntB [Kiloniella majae]
MNEHILMSYDFDGQGGGQEIVDTDAISQKIKDDKFAWIHLDLNHPDTQDWLEKEISYLDPFIVDSLTAEETRPRITEIGDGALVILRGVNLHEGADPTDMISIRLWIDQHRVISAQKRQLKAVYDIANKLKIGKGPRDAGHFVALLISHLSERMESVLIDLNEQVDQQEEAVMEQADKSLRETVANIRKQVIILRRYISPQRDAISQLKVAELDWLSNQDKRLMQESFNQVTRFVEDLDALRERTQVIKDELVNILSDKLNKNMYTISVIAAIFMPLGFLTGLLGINVGGIPGSSSDSAFWVFSGLLVLVVAIQIYIFKKFKWF